MSIARTGRCLLVALVVILAPPSFAAEPLLDAEAKAMGFLLAQDASLTRIVELYPDLKFDAEAARAAFAARFGSSKDNILDAIMDVFGNENATIYLEKVSEAVTKSNEGPLNREQSAAFITLVRERANGNIEDPFLKPILAYQYRDNPAREFSDGYRQSFSVKGHPKSNGMDFHISVPTSWSVYEGERPHVVQNFKTLTRTPYATESIGIIDLDADPMIAAIKGPVEITEADLPDLMPPGARMLSMKMTTLENRPAGILVYDWEVDRLGTKMLTRAHVIVTVSGHSLIILTGLASGLTPEIRDKNWKLYEPLFLMVGNSFVDKLAYQ